MSGYITINHIKNITPDKSDAELEEIAEQLNDKVAGLVGEEIITSLTPDDVDTLAEMQDTTSEENLVAWISERVPDHEEIIEDNTAIVLGEYAESVEEK